MGTTSQKLQYLTTTKSNIKDAINLTGANILSEDTFRSYADKLKQGLVDAINDGGSTIYSNFPKTTQIGTEIALNDTYEAPMEIGLNGNTEQDGEPTPDVPVDVKVVTGDNTIKVEGKNLFDIENATVKEGYAKDDNGDEISSIGSNYTTSYTKVLPNTAYTISYDLSSAVARIYYYDKQKNWISRTANIVSSSNKYTFTTPNNCYYLQFQNVKGFGTAQLELGNTATSYEPYKGATYPVNLGNIELCKIGTYQDYIYKSGDNWYKHSEIGKFNLNDMISVVGNTTQYQNNFNSTNGVMSFRVWKTNFKRFNIKDVAFGNCFSNKFKAITGGWNSTSSLHKFSNVDGFIFWVTYDEIGLDAWASTISDIATRIPQYLGDVIFYLPLATPTDTEITDTDLIEQLEALEKAKSVEGQTNITQTNEELPFILDVSALSKN